MDGQGGTHGGQGAARRVGRAVRASGEDVGVGLASHRSFTLQATGVAMANATYMFPLGTLTIEPSAPLT